MSQTVGVVTACYRPAQDQLSLCIESVSRQPGAIHYLVCDGEIPDGVVESERLKISWISGPHRDGGSAARAVGGLLAAAAGVDAVTYLDADNWFENGHIEKMFNAAKTKEALVVSCARWLYTIDGQLMGLCPEVNGKRFVDTNCMFIMSPAMRLLSNWAFINPNFSPVCDRIFWAEVMRSEFPRFHTPVPSVCYRTSYEVHYKQFGLPMPKIAKRLISTPSGVRVEFPYQ